MPEKLIPASPVLSVDQSLKSFQIQPGFVIEPVVSEPLIDKPVCLDFDSRGRMWVCEMRGYMADIDGSNETTPEGRIVILEDSDQDGKVDKRTVFLEKLLLPRAVSVAEDGVLFIEEHQISWIKRNGDAPIGEPRVIDSKITSQGNVEHKPNGLLANLDNRYYLAKSNKRLRREGDDWKLEPTSFRGQWGVARDNYGRLYHNNNSTLLFGDQLAPNLLLGNPEAKMKVRDSTQLGSNLVWPARVTPGVNRAYIAKAKGFKEDILDPKTFKLKKATAAAGLTIYRGTNFPADWQGMAFTTESSVNLIKATRITERDGKLKGEHPLGQKEFLTSTDERFRPVSIYNAPDGSLYLLDMYHGIVQHKTYMSSYLRKQILDRDLNTPGFGHGRIYRIRSAAGTLEKPIDLNALNASELVKMLGHRNAWQREAAQRLLVSRNDPQTYEELTKLATSSPQISRIHAIWTLEGIGQLKSEHIQSAIQSSDAKLQSSALWASTRLSTAEFAKLEETLLTANPSGPEVMPYLVRAIGPIGTANAFARLGDLLKKSNKIAFVREAIVSGLDQHELAFRDAALKDSKDKKLLEWLEQSAKQEESKVANSSALDEVTKASYERGKSMYLGEAACFGCHGTDGAGVTNLGPPLDESEWVNGKPAVLLNILLNGLTGPITVAGEHYKPLADMPGLGSNPRMSDQTIADVSTYIRNEWSNRSGPVTEAEVKARREANKGRKDKVWTAQELLKIK